MHISSTLCITNSTTSDTRSRCNLSLVLLQAPTFLHLILVAYDFIVAKELLPVSCILLMTDTTSILFIDSGLLESLAPLQRDHVCDSARKSELLESLLVMAGIVRRDHQLRGCLACVSILLEDRSLWFRFEAANGLRLIADILGPPPAAIAFWEYLEHKLWERPHLQGKLSEGTWLSS